MTYNAKTPEHNSIAELFKLHPGLWTAMFTIDKDGKPHILAETARNLPEWAPPKLYPLVDGVQHKDGGQIHYHQVNDDVLYVAFKRHSRTGIDFYTVRRDRAVTIACKESPRTNSLPEPG